VEETRRIATNVDWPCRVETFFRETNLGCKGAVAGAITWFFDNEEEGIILEDDTVPNSDFFVYCDSLLDTYRNDPRVVAITGDNFQDGLVRGEASYYFSRYPHVWGWATWRRAWSLYDPNMISWIDANKDRDLTRFFPQAKIDRYWRRVFNSIAKGGHPNSWAFPWTACVLISRGLTATPNVNLVTNVGFGSNATHTKDPSSHLSNISTAELGEIVHPDGVWVNEEADQLTFQNVFSSKPLRLTDFRQAIEKRINQLLPRKKV
jgi:hypothetical protein